MECSTKESPKIEAVELDNTVGTVKLKVEADYT